MNMQLNKSSSGILKRLSVVILFLSLTIFASSLVGAALPQSDNCASATTQAMCDSAYYGGCCDWSGGACTHIPSGCTANYCGDGKCTYPEDNSNDNSNCFKDCFNDGWNTTYDGWSLNADKSLHANTGASNIALITNYGMDLRPYANYTLTYTLSNPNSCRISFDLNNGLCANPSTFLQSACFNNQVLDANNNGMNRFNIPSSGNSADGYFNDAHIRILVQTGCSGVDISNIALSESSYASDLITFNYSKMKTMDSLSSCCPSTYCWDGSECVSSDLWMDNATRPAIWNDMFDGNLTNDHVYTSSQPIARGYRCVLNASGAANWVASDIKYDWNYMASGYCALSTDCYVGPDYHPELDSGLEGYYSQGCIHHNEIITDKDPVTGYSLGSGNHYCYMGNWTTRSYIIAQLLQNMSTDSTYTMHCYDSDEMTFNTPSTQGSDMAVLSACVLVKSIDSGTDQIITGIIPKTNDGAAFLSGLSGFITEYSNYYDSISGDASVYHSDCTQETSANIIPSTNFTTCIEKSSDGESNGMYLYYNLEYKYFVMSNDPIDALTKPTFWSMISKFFKGLFRPNVNLIPYSAINYTSSYDRLYIAQSSDGPTVLGIEEYKYDENNKSMATILSIKYDESRTNSQNNPINMTQILRAVNQTVPDAKYVSYSNGQEVIIRTENRTGLWRYFTSSSRPQLK